MNNSVIQDIMEYIEYLDLEMGVSSANIEFNPSDVKIKCCERQGNSEKVIVIERGRK